MFRRMACWILVVAVLGVTATLPAQAGGTGNPMPQFFQTDYPNTRFGSGSVASSGCCITALAMVASAMTGHTYYPDELAEYFGGYGYNNVQRMEYASDMLQLPWRRAENIHDVIAALQEGNLAILLMKKPSAFTNSQHFIVVTEMTEDGRFYVNDPYGPNYDKRELKNGFQYGFSEEDLVRGYDGGWIYNVNAMPQDPFIYVEEKPYIEPRYPEIELSWQEQELLARVLWVEARGESPEGQQAVAEVVFNRMVSEDFSNTLSGVIYAEGQFRSVPFLEDAEPYQTQYDAIDRALNGPYLLEKEVVHFATYPVNDHVWGQIGGHIFCYGWQQ